MFGWGSSRHNIIFLYSLRAVAGSCNDILRIVTCSLSRRSVAEQDANVVRVLVPGINSMASKRRGSRNSSPERETWSNRDHDTFLFGDLDGELVGELKLKMNY